MTFRERLNLIRWALGLGENPNPPKPVPVVRITWDIDPAVRVLENGIEVTGVGNMLVQAGVTRAFRVVPISPFRVLMVKGTDPNGQFVATIQGPTGDIREVSFSGDDPFTLPPEFQLRQLGQIGGNVKLDSSNDSPGAVVAQALRRFNHNVLRLPGFRAAVMDEVNSAREVPQISTVLVAMGEDVPGTAVKRQRFQITVERTDKEPPDKARADHSAMVAKGRGE